MPNVDAIANIDAVADQQKFLSDPDSRIRIVLQIRIREANKLRIRPGKVTRLLQNRLAIA